MNWHVLQELVITLGLFAIAGILGFVLRGLAAAVHKTAQHLRELAEVTAQHERAVTECVQLIKIGCRNKDAPPARRKGSHGSA